LADDLAQALAERGAEDLQAVLAARTGMMAFAHATMLWLDDPSIDLRVRLDRAHHALTALLAESDSEKSTFVI
jgi:hypothetical protein